MKNTSTYLFLFLMLIASNISYSQPGWQDLTERYFYTITDENGKEISFKKNKEYSIMIEDKLYRSPTIPQHKLKNASADNFNYTKGYEIQIRINDFSFVVFQNDYYSRKRDTGKELEIKIIHKKDTMFISQSSGKESGEMEWVEVNGVYKNQKRPADFTLQFIPGHYFFPDWAKTLLDNMPMTSGNVKIENVHQQNFIVSEISNPTIVQKMKKYKDERFNTEVIENFKKGYFSLEHKAEPTHIENESPFVINPTIIELILPAQNKDTHTGLIEYNYITPDLQTNITRFASIDAAENKIKLWTPTEKAPYFSTSKIYNDTFNQILYNRSVIKDTTCDESQLNRMVDCPYTIIFYRSSDGGETWQENKAMTNLFDKYEIRTIEFLDKEYSLVYRHENASHRITQGIYYLLKNLQIVDSLKSPDGIHYNEGYNNYKFAVKRDTVFLGNWNENPNNYLSTYFQPYLTKVEGEWKFQVEERTAGEAGRYAVFNQRISVDSIKEYQNFTLVNKNTLVFKNGAGTLTLKEDVIDDLFQFGAYHILEHENQIYLINYNGHTYFSHNGGFSWLLYPVPLKAESVRYDNLRSYRYLKIDEQGTISYLDNGWEKEKGKVMQKMFHKFSIE